MLSLDMSPLKRLSALPPAIPGRFSAGVPKLAELEPNGKLPKAPMGEKEVAAVVAVQGEAGAVAPAVAEPVGARLRAPKGAREASEASSGGLSSAESLPSAADESLKSVLLRVKAGGGEAARWSSREVLATEGELLASGWGSCVSRRLTPGRAAFGEPTPYPAGLLTWEMEMFRVRPSLTPGSLVV